MVFPSGGWEIPSTVLLSAKLSVYIWVILLGGLHMAQFSRGWWRPAAVISSAAFVAVLSGTPVNALADDAVVSNGTKEAVAESVVEAVEQATDINQLNVTLELSSLSDESVTDATGTNEPSGGAAIDGSSSTKSGASDEPGSSSTERNSSSFDSSKSNDPISDNKDQLDEDPDIKTEIDTSAGGNATSSAASVADSNKTISEGTYAIGSGNSVSSVVDAQNGGRTNGTNVQLYESNMTDSQKWDVKYHESDGGYYTIGLTGTDLVLDVQWAEAKSGSNVWLYESNGSKAQRWSIIKNDNGLWSVLSMLGNYYLDVQGGGTSNGTNLQIFEGNGTGSQRFYFLQYNPAAPEGEQRPISDGIYVIGSNKSGGSKVLDVDGASMEDGGNIQIYSANGTGAQRFYFEYDGEGYYTITNLGSGKVLDLNGSGIQPGTNIQQYASNGTGAQKWAVRKDGSVYYFVNKATGLALDAQWAGDSNGTNVWGYLFDKSSAQRWLLTKDDGFIKTGSDGSAFYSISSFNNVNRVFDIQNGSSASGAALQLWDSNDSLAQRFEVYSLGKDEYRIRTAASGGWLTIQDGKIVQSGNSKTAASSSNTWKAVWTGGYFSLISGELAFDVTGGSVSSGTRVQAYVSNGTAAQHFFFRAADLIQSGYYTIASALGSNKTLDVNGGSFTNGSNVQIYTSNDTNAQKFKISKSGNYYVITAGDSNCALDAQNGGTENGTNVQLYSKNGTQAQSWTFKIADGGGVTIVNKGSGRVLDVDGAAVQDGANVQLYDLNQSKAQIWVLSSTELVPDNGWKLVGGRWYFNGNAFTTSCYNAWERIKNLSGEARASSYGVQKYIITIDNTACRVAVFEGKQGDWRPIYDWAAGVGDASTYDHGTFLTDDPAIGGKGFDMYIGNNWDGTQIHNASIPSDGLVAFTSFFGAQGFHSTCGNHSDPSQTGKQISHGCVRLLEENAWWIYNYAPLGTLVYSF